MSGEEGRKSGREHADRNSIDRVHLRTTFTHTVIRLAVLDEPRRLLPCLFFVTELSMKERRPAVTWSESSSMSYGEQKQMTADLAQTNVRHWFTDYAMERLR